MSLVEEDLFEALKSGVKKRHNHIIYVNEDEGMAVCSENNDHVHEVTRDIIQEAIPSQPQIDPMTGQPVVDPMSGQPVMTPEQPAQYGEWYVVESEDGHTHEIAVYERKKKRKKKQPEDEVVQETISLWRQATEVEADSLDAAEEAEEFYSGKGQWDKRLKNELEDTGRCALTINNIGPKIDELCGHQRQQRTEIKYSPMEGGDAKTADLLTFIVKDIQNKNMYQKHKAKVFLDQCILGRGWFSLGVEIDDRLQPQITIGRFPGKNVRVGPHEEEDASDAEYLCTDKMYSKSALENMYPTKAGKIHREWDIFETRGRDHTSYAIDQYAFSDNEYRVTEGGEIMVDIGKKEFRLVTCQRKMIVTKYVAYSRYSEEVFDLENWDLKDVRQLDSIEGIIPIEHEQTKIRITKIAGGLVLSDENPADLPTNDFHIVPSYAYKIDNDFWGKVEYAKDPQREINKRRSQAVDIGNSVVSHGWFYDDSTFPGNQGEQFKKNATKPRFFIKVNNVKNLPEQVKGGVFPQEIVALLQMADQDLNRILNIQAREPGVNTSAAAILQAQKSKLVGNEFLFDNLANAQKKVGRLLLPMIKRYYTPRRIFRLVNTLAKKEITENPNNPPMAGGKPILEYTLEDITELFENDDLQEYDTIVEEAESSPAMRTTIFLLLMELARSGTPVPPNMLIEYSDLPQTAKDKLLTALSEQAQQQQAEGSGTRDMEIVKSLIGKGLIPPKIQEEYQISPETLPVDENPKTTQEEQNYVR